MASKEPIRSFFGAVKSATRRCVRSQSNAISAASTSSTRSHPFSTSVTRDPELTPDPVDVPRWKQTPRAMVAPVRIRPIKPGNEWKINEDPHRLDAVYTRMLGKDGDRLLSEDVKWLAVTHKSFDHGRRGFNDRLAFLGRRIVELQASLALLNMPRINAKGHSEDAYGREAYTHPALDGLQNISDRSKTDLLSKERLAGLAEQYGISAVLRWKPKKADNLHGSGIEVVLVQTLYAIVGAVALQKGGEVANKIVRDRILAPLGVTKS